MAYTGESANILEAALESTEPNEPQDSVPGRGLWNQIRRAEASIKLDQSILHLMLDTLECLDKPRGSVVSPIATDGIQDVISRLALQTREAVDEIRDISEYISDKKGGSGCARDVIEKVLKLRGDWPGYPNLQ